MRARSVCGEIAGVVTGDALVIGLYPATGQEGFAGVATLETSDDQVEIAVYLLADSATPSATPEA